MKRFSEYLNESKLNELGAIGVTLKSADITDSMIGITATSLTTDSVILELNTPSLSGDQLMILVKGGLKTIQPNGKGLKLKF
jgi:hypothetical protein